MQAPKGNEGSLTGDTALAVVAAPAASAQRVIPQNGLTCYNADTVAHVFTVQKNKNSTVYPVWRSASIAAGDIATMAKVVTLDATDESLEVVVDADATTTEPTFDVSYLEVS